MTVQEFSLEFDILYDNAASQGAPGLDIYDKSVFATHAQQEFVKMYYSNYNRISEGFESSENRRRDLDQLLLPYETSTIISSTNGISSDSKFFEIPSETWYIVWERMVASSTDSCINNKMIKVKPVTHDEYNRSSQSPFRKPNKRRAWRMDFSNISNRRVVEIITPFTVNKYMMRYLERPNPIILGNFEDDPETEGRNLTIDGENTLTQIQLNDETHRDILKMAVEIAIQRYRENNLQNSVQLNQKIV